MIEASRELIARGMIALALCGGGYMMLVAPARESLAQEKARGQGLAQRVRDAESVRDQVPALTAALQKARAEAEAFTAMGELARNERQLYARVIAAAESHGVQIDQLSPSKAPPAGAAKGQPKASGDVTVGYQMIATGSYSSIAALIRSLQGEVGFTVVRSIAVHPREAGLSDRVRATIETVHFSFDPRPADQAGIPVASAQEGR